MSDKKGKFYPRDRISVIRINDHIFAVDIMNSKEIIPLPQYTPIPNTDKHLLGVFNLRGEIYPLIDISSILGMDPKKVNETDMVVLLNDKKLSIGILADNIIGINFLEKKKIRRARGNVPEKMERFVYGIIENNNSSIIILDVARLFSSPVLQVYH